MLAIKPRSLACTFIALVLLMLTMDPTSPAQAASSQTAQELLQAMIGQKLLMRHFGDSKDTKVKKKDLTISKENCDIAIQIKDATWEKGKALFVWEDIGTPYMPGKPRGVCHNVYNEGTLTITGFAADEPATSLADSLRKVLQTPEQFLEAAGISFTLPPEPDLPGEVGIPEKPFTPAKPLFIVDATFSEQARKNKYQGNLAVVFYVGTDGRAHNPKIYHPLGMGLDEQALNVVSMWRFEPARKLDQPVPARMSIETSFNLY
jgi:TonB family protein